ncbi:hypothetical protein G9A89_023604 [Geosiphon pyriformis]|nr:hypothetical protein G9A89_023604 [Geosiphon pyriformis]
MICILLECNLSLGGSLASTFWFSNGMSITAVLGKALFFKFLPFIWHYGIAFVDQLQDHCGDIFDWHIFKWWKKLNPRGLVPEWFGLSVVFLSGLPPSLLALISVGPLDICGSSDFISFNDCLSQFGSGSFQTALDACKSELGLLCPDFCNWCWVKCRHIGNIIRGKNLKVSWHKVKDHSGILGNDCADSLAENASLSNWFLLLRISEHFLMADGDMMFGNFRYFVWDIFCAVHCAHWEIGSGSGFLAGGLLSDVDWLRSSQVWHPDLHMVTNFTSKCTADSCTYFMKALHHQLSMAVEVLDYVFFCSVNSSACCHILNSGMFSWKELSGLFFSSLCVLQLLSTCASDLLVSSFSEAVSVFHNSKVAGARVTDFACSICLAFRNDIWLVYAKHRTFMEKRGLISKDGSVYTSASGSASVLSAGVIKLLGISEAFGVCFGFCKPCLFFSGINSSVSVIITA